MFSITTEFITVLGVLYRNCSQRPNVYPFTILQCSKPILVLYRVQVEAYSSIYFLLGCMYFFLLRVTAFSWGGGGGPSCIPKSHIHSPQSSSGFLLLLSLVTQQLWTVAGGDDAFWQLLSLALALRPGKLSHFLSGLSPWPCLQLLLLGCPDLFGLLIPQEATCLEFL